MDPDDLVTIRTFSNRMQAEIALTALESNGIAATISADDCGGVRPELQMASGARLMVNARDRKKADRILTRFERQQRPRPDYEQYGGDYPETQETGPQARAGKGPSRLIWFIIGAVIASLAWGYHWHYEKHRTGIYNTDANRDGRWDGWWTYENGRLLQSERDRNLDGEADVLCIYEDGFITEVQTDQNFDGHSDVWQYYSDDVATSAKADVNFDGHIDSRYVSKDGVLSSSKHDTDYNGEFDMSVDYRAGVIHSLEVRPNGSKVVIRRERYDHGVLQTEWLDTDRDGSFDLERSYDPMGIMTAERRLHTSVENR